MESMQALIDQMVSCICFQAARLDEVRLQMFMAWLASHSSAMRNTEWAHVETNLPFKWHACSLRASLRFRFKALLASELIWEYRLILTEIRWWRDLDEARLAEIVLECLGSNS